MFENAFNNIDRALRNDEGLASELDYAEQTSWLLFLKYLADFEQEREDEAGLEGRDYTPILDPEYRWGVWAAPKDEKGELDLKTAKTGEDLVDFVNTKLFPYLKTFQADGSDASTLDYKIGQIFAEITNRFRSGYSLREVIDIVDTLDFGSSVAKHELSDLYEVRIKRMGNAGRNGGEYYTPRSLIRAMIKVVDPQIGESIYDGAAGSAGFLCEAWDYLKKPDLSSAEWDILQRKTFYGQEKKSLAYVLGVMNMILHGIETPSIRHTNTLTENVMDIQEADKHDVVLANPPFGGGERKEVQQNFPIKSGETAYLFLQHFMRKLKAGGRSAVVIKDTFLSNPDKGAVELRRELLASCNLHTILDCPDNTFLGAGIPTVVLFFEKGAPTRHIWYYQLDPGRSLGKTDPLNDADLGEFVAFQPEQAQTVKSWTTAVSEIDQTKCDLAVRNPHSNKAAIVADPTPILDQVRSDWSTAVSALGEIQSSLAPEIEVAAKREWPKLALRDFVILHYGKAYPVDERDPTGEIPLYGANGIKEYSTRALASGPSLVIGRKGSAGEVTRVEGKFWPLDVTYFTQHDAELIDFDFLEYLLRQLNLPSMARGVKPGINREEVYSLIVSLPPKNEQRRIVSLLDEVIGKLTDAEAAIQDGVDSAKRLRFSMLQNALAGKLT